MFDTLPFWANILVTISVVGGLVVGMLLGLWAYFCIMTGRADDWLGW